MVKSIDWGIKFSRQSRKASAADNGEQKVECCILWRIACENYAKNVLLQVNQHVRFRKGLETYQLVLKLLITLVAAAAIKPSREADKASSPSEGGSSSDWNSTRRRM